MLDGQSNYHMNGNGIFALTQCHKRHGEVNSTSSIKGYCQITYSKVCSLKTKTLLKLNILTVKQNFKFNSDHSRTAHTIINKAMLNNCRALRRV